MSVARRVASAACLLVGGVALADEAHDRLQARRAAADARFAQAERSCAGRFIVSSCVEAARDEHRAALAELRSRELELDDRERRAATAARAEAIEAKRAHAAEAAATAATAATTATTNAVGPAAASAAPPTRDATGEAPRAGGAAGVRPASPAGGRWFPAPSALPKPTGPTGAARAAREREREAAYEHRNEQIAAHRDEVLRRNAERAASGKAAAPLPPASGPAR